MNSSEFAVQLGCRARSAGIVLDSELSARLETYFRLLTTWNRRINLTGLNLDDPTPEVLDRILLEPLAASRHVAAEAVQVLDIGSGGGSPAIPLALALPRVRLRMVESKTRKSVFLREAVQAVGLVSAEVITARLEEMFDRASLRDAHDLLTVRAVRVDLEAVTAMKELVRPGGQVFLFRGRAPEPAWDKLAPPLVWSATYPLLESSGSCLVVLSKTPR